MFQHWELHASDIYTANWPAELIDPMFFPCVAVFFLKSQTAVEPPLMINYPTNAKDLLKRAHFAVRIHKILISSFPPKLTHCWTH